MEDKSKKTDNFQEVKSTEDFEMGESSPKINHYKDVKKETSVNEKPKIDPIDVAPQKTEPITQEFKNISENLNREETRGQTIGEAKKGINPQSEKGKEPVNPAARKKAVIGCLGAFGSIALIFLVLSFVFLAQSENGGEPSPIATLLGINQDSFVNSLITLIHIIFILTSLTVFVFTMIGLFKASMAKKDDKEAKKSGLKMSIIAGATLVIILISWMFVYVYLDAKRVQISPEILTGIVTEPAETLNLTAPADIRFDASNVQVDKTKFQIISFDWDFGDGETGTSPIVSHTYTQKGRFDVFLTVTKRDRKTSQESQDQYTTIVSIGAQALTAVIKADPQSGEAPLEVKLDASESVDPDGKIKEYAWDLDEDGLYDDAEEAQTTNKYTRSGKYKVSLRVTSLTGKSATVNKEIVVGETIEPEAIITVTDEPETFEVGVSYVFKADDSKSPNGKIEKYEWTFSDKTKNETTKTVSHVFEEKGTYEVTLKVTDEKEKTGEVTKTIKVGAQKGAPKAKITTNPVSADGPVNLEGKVPFTINFDASQTTDQDENIVEYEWDFNSDGTVDEYGKTASYTYVEIGTYTASLTVIDADENKDTGELVILVKEKGITAEISAKPIEGSVPLTVKFDASGSIYDGGTITSYKWDFGDGGSPKLGDASISHKYASVGTFTAKVTVIGSDNTTDTKEILITVREVALDACFEAALESGKAPLQTTFDPSCSSGTISKYFWNFGDGGTSTDIKPKHTFESAGEYTVILEVTDSENTVSKSEMVIKVTK